MPIDEQARNDIDIVDQGTRDTGFIEPLSTERNTMLPHNDAQTAPHEELDTDVIKDKLHHRRPHIPGHHHNKHEQEQHAEKAQAEMYSGLDVEENPDDGKSKHGAAEEVLNKISCGTV